MADISEVKLITSGSKSQFASLLQQAVNDGWLKEDNQLSTCARGTEGTTYSILLVKRDRPNPENRVKF